MVLVQKELYKAYIGEDPTWKPNEHTVAYRPLTATTTVNDQSGNSYNLAQTGGSFTTLWDVSCFYNGWSTTGYLNLTSASKIPTWSADRTISLWVNPTGYSSSYSRYIFCYWKDTGTNQLFAHIHTNKLYRASNYQSVISWKTMTANTRALLTMVVSGGNLSFYVDGVSASSTTLAVTTQAISSSYPLRLMRMNTSSSANYQTRGYLSEVIIEDKAWTATEIANYFNDNKAKYWL